MLKKKIAEIKIELPSADRHYSEAEWMDSEFERREIVHYKHAGIGSGFALSELKECEDLNRTGPIYTRGILTYKIGWQNPVPNRSLKENDCVYTELRQAVDRWGCLDKNALNRLLDDGKLIFVIFFNEITLKIRRFEQKPPNAMCRLE